MVDVEVHPPQIHGSTATFTWTSTEPNPHQPRSSWSISYPGVDLDRLDPAVLWEVFLTLQLHLFSQAWPQARVQFPDTAADLPVRWWATFRRLDNLTVVGTGRDRPARSPWRRRAPRSSRRGRGVAVSYGAGKDSSLALHSLLAAGPASEVLVLHLVQHVSRRKEQTELAFWRSRQLALAPAAALGATRQQLVSTDYFTTLRRTARRPHVTLYFTAVLPALIHHGVTAVTVSRTALGYRVEPLPGGELRWSNPGGRPERLAALTAYYRDVYDLDLQFESTHYAIGELVSFNSLRVLHPEAMPTLLMCVRGGQERWCHECAKCLEFTLFSLATGHHDPDLDMDRVFADGHGAVLAQAATEVADQTAWHGNAPFAIVIGTPSHFATFGHALHSINPESAELNLSGATRESLRALRSAWGRVPFPATVSIDQAAVAAAGPLGRLVAGRAATVHPARELDRDEILLVGDRLARFAHDQTMALPQLWEVLGRTDPATASLRPHPGPAASHPPPDPRWSLLRRLRPRQRPGAQ